MGYIFDALNKASQPDPQPPQRADDGGQASLADLAATLRLEDILAKHAAQAQAPQPEQAGMIASALDAASPRPDAATRPDRPRDQSLTAAGATDEPETEADTADARFAAPTAEHTTLEPDEVNESTPRPFRLPGVVTSAPAVGRWYQFWKKPKANPFDDRLVVLTGSASSMAEEYRSTRTSILARHQNERHLVHTITSATPQEGKTITCLNLGLAFAELRNRKTIVVECDLRLPTFEKLLLLDQPTGLISYLHGEASLSEIITQVPGTGLDVITAGGRVSDEAVQMLSSTRMSRLIQSLRAKYDHVIIDTPPVVDLADAGILGAQGDEVLLVARMRRTPQPLVEQAIRTLNSYNAQVAGVIATDNPRARGRGYGYRYGYGYGYRYTYSGKRRGRHAA